VTEQQDKPQRHQIPEKRKAAIVKAAAKWWNETGRRLVNKRFDLEETGRKVKAGGNAPGVVIAGEVNPTIPSPLLLGQPWDDLAPRERGQILKVYMHNFTEYKFRDLEQRQNSLAIPPSAIN
jgi:hypothetical protein